MKRARTCLSLGVAVLLVGLWGGPLAHAASGESAQAPPAKALLRPPPVTRVAKLPYLIGPEDVLDIVIKDSPELSRQVVVRSDGKITLPILGDVDVGGRTPEKVEELVKAKATPFLREPIFVTVIVVASRNARVYLMGGGVEGNVVPLTRPITLLQLLAQTNLSEDADLQSAFVLRAGEKLSIDFENLVKQGDLSQNVRMEPDDLVFVPLNDPFVGRIKVVGEVGNPQIIPYREGITLLDAILMANGPTPFANQNGAKIIRIDGTGKEKVVKVKLKNLLKGDLSKNVLLEPNDTIVVPQSLF